MKLTVFVNIQNEYLKITTEGESFNITDDGYLQILDADKKQTSCFKPNVWECIIDDILDLTVGENV